MSLIALLLLSSIGFADDYNWMRDFNIKAEADPSGLRARLEARFQVGDIKIKAVLGSVDNLQMHICCSGLEKCQISQ